MTTEPFKLCATCHAGELCSGAGACQGQRERQSHSDESRSRQIDREAAARQAALGQRAKAIQDGRLGPVLRRWINADVVPIASLLRNVAKAYLGGSMEEVARYLDTPVSELQGSERPLTPLMQWVLRGSSPGRAEKADTTHAEDLALAFMAALVMRLAKSDKTTIAAALAHAADALRDTVQGQFIVSIQGAKAMQRVRENRPEHWKQKKSLNRICARLHAQVKSQLESEARGEIELDMRGNKKVLHVKDVGGELRRLELRAPDAVDWEVMSLCWQDETSSGTSPHRSLWLGFAGVLLAASQKVGGWFEVAQSKTGRKRHTRTTKYLVLSEAAADHIRKDVERWTSLGFNPQPMIVPPEDGDYLTVKHRPVSGQKPPLGLLTRAGGTSAWRDAASALADTPWTVNTHCLAQLPPMQSASSGGSTGGLAGKIDKQGLTDAFRIAEHRRLASEPVLYLPVTMDFRGRIYYRTPWVTPQSGDLGKALLCWPPSETVLDRDAHRALIMHLASLKGGGLDKAPYPERFDWWAGLRERSHPAYGAERVDLEPADKPLSLRAALALVSAGQADRVPVQLDGTCNGLQHLTALMRDDQAAPHVNLTASTLEDRPADLYGLVARLLQDKLVGGALADIPWVQRFVDGGLTVDRKLTKGPVMVLPYGGTREAVRLSLKASVIERLRSSGLDQQTPWHKATLADASYLAFAERDLDDHPLFNQDIARLTELVWECITPSIPKAMAVMRTLQEIGKWVGERALSWRVGSSRTAAASGTTTDPSPSSPGDPLWVVQAKSKASRKQVTMRGFHLPNMVRRLTLMANLNEIDGKAARVGIVANFIHSLDAAHLAAAIGRFRAMGGGCVGSVHDCLLTRPSEAGLMGRALRDTFAEMYEEDPLSWPVRVGTPGLDEVVWTEYPSWYALAAEAGTSFPVKGSYDVNEVRKSAWFFS